MVITILATFFVLSIVVLVHEFGHFIVAKMSKVYVKTFSFGFGKKIIRKRFGETEYAWSLLPFGGYVKFAGESSGEGDEESADPNEVSDKDIHPSLYFRNKRGLIKSAVVFAGPFMNYVLAILLFIGVYYIQGLQVRPITTIGDVREGSPADSVGLKVGDKIVEIDGIEVNTWNGVLTEMIEDHEEVKLLRIDRSGEMLEIPFKSEMEDNLIILGFYPLNPPKVGIVKRDSPAYRAGMKRGAIIEAIDDTTVTSFYDINTLIHPKPETPVVVQWSFEGITHVDTLVPQARRVPKNSQSTETTVVGQIGIGPYYEKQEISLAEAAQIGFSEANNLSVRILGFLRDFFMRRVNLKDAVGGPILIAQMAGEVARWGFDFLLNLLAFISINLCIFNLLPILPFDGGHLALFAVEGVTRRPIKDRIREILSQIGFVILILLMVSVILLDLSKCYGVSPGVL